MAALGRPFGGLALGGAPDFLPPPPAFPARALPPGPDGLEAAPRAASAAGAAAAAAAGAEARAAPGGRRVPLRCKKKHKREEDDGEDCPVRKKRLTAAGPGDWLLCAPQNAESHGMNSCASDLATPGLLDAACEEMDHTAVEPAVEPQCEAARRRLQEIEDRIIDEDEEVEADRNISHLPSLVLSDTMKTGLKREIDEVFTKKIIESMSRPSMELVLWKPLPELLSEKPKPLSNAKNYTGERQTKRAVVGTAFPLRTELLLEPRPTVMPVYSGLDTAACTEEEMEL